MCSVRCAASRRAVGFRWHGCETSCLVPTSSFTRFLHMRRFLRLLPVMTLTLTSAPASAQSPDWEAVARETVAHLQRMIRINTVNPPGNELGVAQYLDSTLKAAGIETRLFEPAPGRAAFVARLRGNGSRRPVVRMAHMDVVCVEGAHWSVEPFGGVVPDGCVYGRGAIDDKGMLAANLVTMLLLRRHVLDAGGALAR